MLFVAHLHKQRVYLSLLTHILALATSVVLSQICLQSLLCLQSFYNPLDLWEVLTSGLLPVCSLRVLHILFSLMKIVLPIYCSSVLNNWHFFGEIFKTFLHNSHSKLTSFSKCVCLLGVNSNRSSMIASKYFLLDKQLKMEFIYDCHTVGEILSPIGILLYKYDMLPKYGSIPQ